MAFRLNEFGLITFFTGYRWGKDLTGWRLPVNILEDIVIVQYFLDSMNYLSTVQRATAYFIVTAINIVGLTVSCQTNSIAKVLQGNGGALEMNRELFSRRPRANHSAKKILDGIYETNYFDDMRHHSIEVQGTKYRRTGDYDGIDGQTKEWTDWMPISGLKYLKKGVVLYTVNKYITEERGSVLKSLDFYGCLKRMRPVKPDMNVSCTAGGWVENQPIQ
jgi:hypothetical protein